MRWTKKDIDQEGYHVDGCGCLGEYMPINEDRIPDMVDKLGEYEDLEERLCIDLKVLQPNQRAWFIKEEEKYIGDIMGINLQNKTIMIGSSWSFCEFPLENYTHTWGLM